MSSLLKNLHVHFDDEVLSGSDAARKGIIPTLNYTRQQLLEYGQSKTSKEPPKISDLSGADDKRKEKIRLVLKNYDVWKHCSQKNGAAGVASKGGVTVNSEQARTNFQQMISAAVSNAHQHNGDYANTRRRIGSGRIVDNHSAQDNIYPVGMDVRYMNNKLFKDDGKVLKSWKSGNDLFWNNADAVNHTTDSDNTDAKSDEPEWANCGPISKHDIIELHGFDGPDNDDTEKSESPPARSTPSKTIPKKTGKTDENFNFEEFLKLDLPPSVNCVRDHSGESRFSQWFGRDKVKYDTKSTQQFFDYHQKAQQKKMNVPNKLRSVDELEADWCPNQAKSKEQKPQTMDMNAIRLMLNQLAAPAAFQKQRSMNTAQSQYLLSLINRSAENLYQYRLSQNAIMKRPDAQLLLHRLVNGEITQYHILQQISNPTIHQHDRETLLAVFAFCNENQQWLLQQQEQQLKHKEHMSQQLRQLQLIQMKNSGMHSPKPQDLQLHTQAIMQNAVYKNQLEEQYRNLNSLKSAHQPKFQSYKTNNWMSNQQSSRFNYKNKQNGGQSGLQFIQTQNKAMWNRHNHNNLAYSGGSLTGGTRNTNELFAATMPTFAKFDASVMSNVNDKVSITVDK